MYLVSNDDDDGSKYHESSVKLCGLFYVFIVFKIYDYYRLH